MERLSLTEYRECVSRNPELSAIIRKDEKQLLLISDMEYGGDKECLRIENMFFDLDTNLPFHESIVECRDRYAGGITFPLENCSSFDEAFNFFVEQSDVNSYWLVDDDTWGNVAGLDFDEIFVVAQ